jgi:rare lipoprotein A (peptidoglycan hydrolase)
MNHEGARQRAVRERRARAVPDRLVSERTVARPDRVAFWAVAMSVVAMLAAAASAQAADGGVGMSDRCTHARFGQRTLEMGDCGTDVKTLNWILRSKSYADGVDLGADFQNPTAATVREFERRRGLAVDGVVEEGTRKALVKAMDRDIATWYGPGFYGNETACGNTLSRRTVGVAHRNLPCGTKVVVGYRGRFITTRVIDRGPYAHGADWDLTSRAAEKLGFTVTDRIKVARVR